MILKRSKLPQSWQGTGKIYHLNHLLVELVALQAEHIPPGILCGLPGEGGAQ